LKTGEELADFSLLLLLLLLLLLMLLMPPPHSRSTLN
jgi:hypothetical protein